MRLLRLAMWVGWFAYWAIAARGAKATQWRAPLAAEWLHYTLALLGTIVLAPTRATPAILAPPFLPQSPFGSVPGAILTGLGTRGLRSRRGSFLRRIGAPPSRSKKITR